MNWIYFLGSIAGIALLVGLNIMLFGATGVKLTSASDAIRRLKEEIAGFRAGDTVIDTAQSAALVENAHDGSLHLVVARGDGLVTRALKKGAVKTLARDGATLSLRLTDFTLPRAKLTLADEALARDWETRLARQAA